MITTVLGLLGAYLIAAGGKYMMLEKMGEEGWKGIVPFLGGYLLYKHAWSTKMFWLSAFTAGAGCVLEQIAHQTATINTPLSTLALVLSLAGAGILINFYYRLAKSFGHGVGSTIGLLFVQPITYFILGASECEYVGA